MSKVREDVIQKVKGYLRGVQPTAVNGTGNVAYQTYWDLLYRIVKGRFKITCPDTWDKDYMLEHLILDEVLLITDTVSGVIPLKTGVSGNNIWNRPNRFITANHILGNIEGIINVDGACIFLNGSAYNNGHSLLSLIERYAYMLAEFDCGIDVNLINTHAAMIFDCADKAQADTAKSIYDKLSRGEPAIFTSQQSTDRNKQRLEFHTINVTQTFAVDRLQDGKRTCYNEFLNNIGIKTANTDKRERLVADEVNSNKTEILCNVKYWNESLQVGCDVANSLYPGINLSIQIEYDNELSSPGREEVSVNDNN